MIIDFGGPFNFSSRLHGGHVLAARGRIQHEVHRRLRKESLIAYRIPAFMLGFVYVATMIEFLPEMFNCGPVNWIGGPNEVIIVDVCSVGQLLELPHVLVTKQLHLKPSFLRCLLYLHAMLVRTCEHGCTVVAKEDLPSLQNVRQHESEQMANMRSCKYQLDVLPKKEEMVHTSIYIKYRRSDVVRLFPIYIQSCREPPTKYSFVSCEAR